VPPPRRLHLPCNLRPVRSSYLCVSILVFRHCKAASKRALTRPEPSSASFMQSRVLDSSLDRQNRSSGRWFLFSAGFPTAVVETRAAVTYSMQLYSTPLSSAMAVGDSNGPPIMLPTRPTLRWMPAPPACLDYLRSSERMRPGSQTCIQVPDMRLPAVPTPHVLQAGLPIDYILDAPLEWWSSHTTNPTRASHQRPAPSLASAVALDPDPPPSGGVLAGRHRGGERGSVHPTGSGGSGLFFCLIVLAFSLSRLWRRTFYPFFPSVGGGRWAADLTACTDAVATLRREERQNRGLHVAGWASLNGACRPESYASTRQ